MNADKEIWVLAQDRKGELSRGTIQLLQLGKELALQKQCELICVLVGGESDLADQVAGFIENVLWLQGSNLTFFEANRHQQALERLVELRGVPIAILTDASPKAQELMPGLAVALETGFASFVSTVFWGGDSLAVTRPVFGGRLVEDLQFEKKPALLTVRISSLMDPKKLDQPGRIEKIPVEISNAIGVEVKEQVRRATDRLDLTEASSVVAGGRGMGSTENFKWIEELAEQLGAAVGATRSVVDAGWRPHEEQVGKSGKTIAPKLYIACGISGAIHHVLGMSGSKLVVAINKDPDALIFKHADIGLVGDVLKIVPELLSRLKETNKSS